jgi:hypothetical protein
MTARQTISTEKMERAKRMRDLGFIHVTGLPTWNPNGTMGYFIQPRHGEMNCTGHNNGVTVVIMPDGEVWIGFISDPIVICRMVTWLNIGQTDAFVPCSNGEQVSQNLILARNANPYTDCHGQYSPVPRPKGPK